jgi:hypothetical protein
MIRKLLLLVLIGLVGALVVGDRAAKGAAESAIASEIAKRTAGVGEVDAEISSFPFVGRLLVQGLVPELTLTLDEVTGHGIDLTDLRVLVRDLEIDRGAITGGKPEVTAIDSMTVTATISEATVRAVSGADVRLLDGRIAVNVAGRTVEGDAVVRDGRIAVDAFGAPLPFGIPVPDTGVLPCTPDVEVVAGALRLRCTAETLPQIVIDAIGAAALRR